MPSTNIAPILCGDSKMRKRSFKPSSIACEPQRTELSLINSCQIAAIALAIQLLPKAESASLACAILRGAPGQEIHIFCLGFGITKLVTGTSAQASEIPAR
jgi:hypothetical protein